MNIKGCPTCYIPRKIFNGFVRDVVGVTRFKPQQHDEDDVVLIGEHAYLVEKFSHQKDTPTGFIPLADGRYVAFYKKNRLLPTLVVLNVALVAFLAVLFVTGTKDVQVDGGAVLTDWVIGGMQGSDLNLNPEQGEMTYNTYKGYQKIVIRKGSNVPFVNSEKNVKYAQFTIFSKEGEALYTSPMIPPGSHEEWDAFSFYKGVPGSYLHDLRVTFLAPLYEGDKIVGFKPSMVAASTPNFEIIIK